MSQFLTKDHYYHYHPSYLFHYLVNFKLHYLVNSTIPQRNLVNLVYIASLNITKYIHITINYYLKKKGGGEITRKAEKFNSNALLNPF